MAKNRKAQETESTESTEGQIAATERVKKGSGIMTQVRNHFKAIMVAALAEPYDETAFHAALANATPTYHALPVGTINVGLDPKVKLQEVTKTIDALMEKPKGEIDRKELTRLLNRQDKLEKEIKKAEEASQKQAESATA